MISDMKHLVYCSMVVTCLLILHGCQNGKKDDQSNIEPSYIKNDKQGARPALEKNNNQITDEYAIFYDIDVGDNYYDYQDKFPYHDSAATGMSLTTLDFGLEYSITYNFSNGEITRIYRGGVMVTSPPTTQPN